MEELSLQAIFTKVATHLLKQGVKAVRDTNNGYPSCLYRDAQGNTCAVGCLIPQEDYSEELEGKTVSRNPRLVRILQGAGVLPLMYTDSSPAMGLLQQLQVVHDSYHPDLWPIRLQEIAKAHDWSMP